MVNECLNIDLKKSIKPMMANIVRFVESQEQIATLNLVHTVYEQGVLEELLEFTKAPLPLQTDSLHYLLKTPFRYPPLKYGSRFGRAFEQGLFYASLKLSTALAETAYYRFVYMLGPEQPFQSLISSEYTAFTVAVKSQLGLFLDEEPFSAFESSLRSPISYTETQALGSKMREMGVELFQFISARDKDKGKNIGLFTPKAFHSKKPIQLRTWICQTSIESVGFISKEDNQRILYQQKEFWVNGYFPQPAI